MKFISSELNCDLDYDILISQKARHFTAQVGLLEECTHFMLRYVRYGASVFYHPTRLLALTVVSPKLTINYFNFLIPRFRL